MPLSLRTWPLQADWREGVAENLEWFTEVLTSINGTEQLREMRYAPRRAWNVAFIAAENERRVMDGFLARVGASKFAMPVWPEGQMLTAAVTVGQTFIPCATTGCGFGSMVVLWKSPTECAAYACTVSGSGITLTPGSDRAWPVGTRLFPGTEAQLFETPRWSEWSDDSAALEVNFTECNQVSWTGVAPVATYRTYPVLEWRPNTWADPEAAHERVLALEDGETGPIVAFDFAAMPFRNVQHKWTLSGRAEHTAWRDLLYALRGRCGVLWVPSWNRDLKPVSSPAAGATVLTIERCGYAQDFGPQRRDIRVEHVDGRVAYMRVASVTAGTSTETVTLATGLPWGFTPATIRSIGFMVLSRGARDAVQINHLTDAEGLASSSLQFRAVRVPGGVTDGL